jgi:hypothetical protein
MKKDKCDFNQSGMCVAADEFPEMEKSPCRYNKEGECTAKPENLISVCPDCGIEHCHGECLDDEEALMVPSSNRNNQIKRE